MSSSDTHGLAALVRPSRHSVAWLMLALGCAIAVAGLAPSVAGARPYIVTACDAPPGGASPSWTSQPGSVLTYHTVSQQRHL